MVPIRMHILINCILFLGQVGKSSSMRGILYLFLVVMLNSARRVDKYYWLLTCAVLNI